MRAYLYDCIHVYVVFGGMDTGLSEPRVIGFEIKKSKDMNHAEYHAGNALMAFIPGERLRAFIPLIS